jgi:hypothetical protein
MRASKRCFCSSLPTSSQYLTSGMPVSTIYFSTLDRPGEIARAALSSKSPLPIRRQGGYTRKRHTDYTVDASPDFERLDLLLAIF